MQKSWIRVVSTITTLGIMMMIFLFSMEPAADSDLTSGVIAEIAANFIHPGWRELGEEQKAVFYNQIQLFVRKCAHFTEFAWLGISLRFCLESWFGKRKWMVPVSWGIGSLYAGLDELHQLAVDGRSGQWLDVMIDSSGVIIGVLIVSFFILRIRDQ